MDGRWWWRAIQSNPRETINLSIIRRHFSSRVCWRLHWARDHHTTINKNNNKNSSARIEPHEQNEDGDCDDDESNLPRGFTTREENKSKQPQNVWRGGSLLTDNPYIVYDPKIETFCWHEISTEASGTRTEPQLFTISVAEKDQLANKFSLKLAIGSLRRVLWLSST